jgi:hypothetical protein
MKRRRAEFGISTRHGASLPASAAGECCGKWKNQILHTLFRDRRAFVPSNCDF